MSVTFKWLEQPFQPDIEQQIISLWVRTNLVSEAEREQRLSEVVAMAMVDGEVIAICSKVTRVFQPINRPLHYLRAMTAPEFHRKGVSLVLTGFVTRQLEAHFNSGQDVECIGVWAAIEADYVDRLEVAQCYFHAPATMDGEDPQRFDLLALNTSNKTGRVTPHLVHYFQHASLFQQGPTADASPVQVSRSARILAVDKLLNDSDPYRLEYCYGRMEAHQSKAVTDLWLQQGVMPDLTACAERLPSVAGLAWSGDQLMAVGSVFVSAYEPLKSNLLGYRSFVRPEARGSATATALMKLIVQNLNDAYQTGKLRGLPGIAIVLQNDKLNTNVASPVGETIHTVLAGYLNGAQVRLVYFEGATIAMPSRSNGSSGQ